jgi:hypothetical protein
VVIKDDPAKGRLILDVADRFSVFVGLWHGRNIIAIFLSGRDGEKDTATRRTYWEEIA